MPNENDNANEIRILVVDDEQSIRQFYADIVPRMFPKINVDLAEDGLEAAALYKDFHHPLLILDVMMPRMDGIAAYELICLEAQRTQRRKPVVIFCTGYAPPERLQRLVSEKDNVYLFMKPVSLMDMLKIIQDSLFPAKPA